MTLSKGNILSFAKLLTTLRISDLQFWFQGESAVRIVRDVLGAPDQAKEIEDESLDIYAERRKIFFPGVEVFPKQAL